MNRVQHDWRGFCLVATRTRSLKVALMMPLRSPCRPALDYGGPGPCDAVAMDQHRKLLTIQKAFTRSTSSFDHLVGAGEHRGRNFEAEGLRGRQIDDEIKLGRLLDWQVGRLCPAQNLVDKIGSAPELAWPI
jgi:hypothetical protein